MSTNIKATIIADSINPNGTRLTTFEFEYPRFIHSEVMTHRMLSKNAASSRAIPIERMLDTIRSQPAMPIYWGENQSGMSARTELMGMDKEVAVNGWLMAMHDALYHSDFLAKGGLHKQLANRVTEPFQTMKTVISGTEWANFFWLRDHPDAQPEFQRLAQSAKAAMDISIPNQLKPGEWHLPYINNVRKNGYVVYENNNKVLTLEDARTISASCCAQVSYRKNDDSIEKARMIFDRLVNTTPVHASPVEHQATPIPDIKGFTEWPQGVTHRRRDGSFWSGNFQDWIQYRQLIANNSVW